MTRRGRPRQADKGASVSSRVRLTAVRRERIDAALFAKALIAAQLLEEDQKAQPTQAAEPKSNEEVSR